MQRHNSGRLAVRIVAIAATALLLGNGPGSGAAPSAGDERAIEEALGGLSQPSAPGCAVGIDRNGVLTTGAYGLADVENEIPIDANTRFDIGSMSKQFLAAGIFILAEQGRINLDADIHAYVPDLPHYLWPVSIRQLLHHTSGIRDYDQLLQAAGWADGDTKSRNDILWVLTRQHSLMFAPGTRYSYSDSNYFLLGLAAERVTGKSLSALLDELIFRPLGMNHTQLITDHWAVVRHRAWPYRVSNGQIQLFVNAEEPLGDGGVFSTIGDLALWERNFASGIVGGPRLSAELLMTEPLADHTPNNYAGGLFIRTAWGHRLIEHSGANYGYLSEKLRFPDERLSIIVLCNRRDAPFIALSDRLATAALGLRATPAAPRPRRSTP